MPEWLDATVCRDDGRESLLSARDDMPLRIRKRDRRIISNCSDVFRRPLAGVDGRKICEGGFNGSIISSGCCGNIVARDAGFNEEDRLDASELERPKKDSRLRREASGEWVGCVSVVSSPPFHERPGDMPSALESSMGVEGVNERPRS